MSEDMEVIGWRVIDPDGNVIDSGGVSRAEMTGIVAEMLGLTTNENKEQ